MKNIRRFLMLLLVFLSLFSFTSCVDLNCETCGDVQNSEVIKLTKKNAISNNKSYTVKATVTPSYAVANLSWKLEYVDGSSSSNISNFVTMSVSSDTKSCTLTKKKTCGKKMKLTCYISNKTSIKATCTIDFFDDSYYFQNECNEIDFSEIVKNDRPLYEVFNRDFDLWNYSYYKTVGGTTRLSVKNIDVDECFLDGDNDYGYLDYNDFFQGSINDVIDDFPIGYFENSTAILWLTGDLYYGNTLIYKSVYYAFEFYPINVY